ncbi:DUF4381 domain-containing protein [Aquipseudomonas ullengensis]|uniref:DUF4381 domain-containing protein n=1 Tax=Aquipseudomonas ullengensis TaxID=2759166 RepID=A0A7W4QBJ8_9GAMM|nr:DUF4381 domain-containing protein [Pseudomonas ullengensis]MBB2497012.1 DUF4381 domain-containing protein [Pseudomonas ullengensis]
MSAPSIEQLQELALPAPVSYLPQTWGWLAVLLLALFALGLWGALRYRRWRQDRYRREALARLAELEQALADAEQRLPALRELPELLKRVALSMPGQPDVATLDGERWQAFLARHSAQPLPDDFSRQLASLAYAPESQLRALPTEQAAQLLIQCRHWVERHHVAA